MQDDPLGSLFEDLEQQAAGLEMAERDAELADRAQGEYAVVTLASRFHASVGRQVVLTVRGGRNVAGTLHEVGADWCLVAPGAYSGHEERWLVRLDQVAQASGLSHRALPEAARPVTARLGFGSALRRIAQGSTGLYVEPMTGPPFSARLVRVGVDFVELVPEAGSSGAPLLVAFGGIRTVRAS